MKIVFDIDGVVCQWAKGFLEYAGLAGLEKYINQWNFWNGQFGFPEEEFEKLWDEFIQSGGIYRLKPVDGAIEAIDSLVEQEHKLYFITARKLAAKDQTLRWFDEYSIDGRVIFCQNKASNLEKLQPDIYVEDAPHHIQNAINANLNSQMIIAIFDKPYNQHFSHRQIRVRNWDDILDLVKVKQANIDLNKHIFDSPAIIKQETPKGNGRPIIDLVMEDFRKRSEIGLEKYGELLRPNNGRDSLIDAYQEALDLCMYLRQAIEEGK